VGNIVLKFTGCETTSGQCNSAGDSAGKVRWNEVDGGLGIWKTGETKVKDKPGISLKPTMGELLAEFVCGVVAVKIRGALMVAVPGNAMKRTTTVKLIATKGKQTPAQFVGGPVEVPECKFAAAPYEQCGLTLTTIQTNEEKIETSTIL
jgi:hypothetical protein